VKSDAGKTLRLFVAGEIPGPALSAIVAWQETELGRHQEIRLTRALHLTFAFLGQLPETRVTVLEEALGKLSYPAVETGVDEVLFLPERGAKRVVALRLADPDGALREHQHQVSRALAKAGLYNPEKRPWLPHVTVARFRRPGHPFSLQNVNIPRFGVVRTVLYSSLLERAGAVHTPLAVFSAS
jgi:2'-5' RNA ligase